MVDWTGGVTLNVLSNDTHLPLGLCGSPEALFAAMYIIPEQINHYHTVFMRVFIPSV